ncbi:MAG: pyridoxal phosphate-dependent aminotransferase [Candidatus Gygaella obscura]|nr:pyridoxal phosphate-dependent aminotransferase [Candidatus Gygaella obscura]
MQLAKRVLDINPSLTLSINSRAKKLSSEGKNIINFAAGEPDFDTPDFIKKRAIKCIEEGFTKYTSASGMPSLKEAICAKLKKENNLTYLPNQVVITCGAKHALFNILQAVIDNNQEVLIPCPYWVSYPEMVTLAGGRSKFIKTKMSDSFKVNPSELKNAITKNTRLLILNSPSNPTGAVYKKSEIEEIAKICVENNIFVISDEIYEKIIFNGKNHFSIGSINDDIYKLTFTVNGVSKSFSMTGWRIGYLAGPAEITSKIGMVQAHSTSNPCSISQMASLEALTAKSDFINKIASTFEKRRDLIVSRIEKMSRVSCFKPEGAFYVFVNISQTNLSGLDFSNRVLDEAGLAVVPGEAFGDSEYVRMSFACSLETIEKGMDRLEKWLQQL